MSNTTAQAPLASRRSLLSGVIPHAKFVMYEGGSHGLLLTDKEKLNADLLAFLKS
jgi:non-heme chloroperoxidase